MAHTQTAFHHRYSIETVTNSISPTESHTIKPHTFLDIVDISIF